MRHIGFGPLAPETSYWSGPTGESSFRLADGTDFRLKHGHPAFQIWNNLIADSGATGHPLYVEREDDSVISLLPSKTRKVLRIYDQDKYGNVRVDFGATDPITFVHHSYPRSADLLECARTALREMRAVDFT